MKHVYCIPALGADERIFGKLNWPEGVTVHYLRWLPPLHTRETLESYTHRMMAHITHPFPILVGVSFGGIMSIEIAKRMPVQQIVLISSITSHRQLPWWMRACAYMHLDALLPQKGSFRKRLPLRFFYPIQNFFLGARSAEARKLAAELRDAVDAGYLKWSIHQVLHWKNDQIPAPVAHMHGKKDRIFSIAGLHPNEWVEDAGHFLVFQQPEPVSRFLQKVLHT